MATSIVTLRSSSSNTATSLGQLTAIRKESREQHLQMPSPTMSESDAACALLMGHRRQCPASSVVSFSLDSDIANDCEYTQESSVNEGGTMIQKHGFVIESSSIRLADTLSSRSSTITNGTATSTSIKLPAQQRRPRSGSEGLDYLAFLAEQERHQFVLPLTTTKSDMAITGHPTICVPVIVTPPTTIVNNPATSSSSSSSDTDDSEAMPPPQPRRPRSVSNPDYMMNMQLSQQQQQPITTMKQHFVLPPHLLRQELAEARGAVVRKAAAAITNTPYRYSTNGFRSSPSIPEDSIYVQSSCDNFNCYSDTTGNIFDEGDEDDEMSPDSGDEYDDDDDNDDEADIGDEEVILGDGNIDIQLDASISATELLRRARSRLLEDLLSEANLTTMNGANEKSNTLLPHNLSKYKMVYNQNGRIGIYTPQERTAIIARYHSKRSRRNWNKKIRYNCRKSLADRRLRVKGRFVKRSIEKDQECQDSTMPDVNDPDAGFCPTVDQPYRRLRRHTVT